MPTLTPKKLRKESPFATNTSRLLFITIPFAVYLTLDLLYKFGTIENLVEAHELISILVEKEDYKPKQKQHYAQWQLWHEMPPTDQDSALEKAMARAKPYGEMLGRHEKYHNLCPDGKKPVLFGKGGEHMVCGPEPKEDEECNFLSFGIRDDPSFDIHLGATWNCRGFCGDPSITHPSKFSPSVSFHNIGLTMLRDNWESLKNPKDRWILTSLPRLREFLGWDYLNIVKIDCEGCEVAMSRDILREDPFFLDRVGQISIETHVTKTWVKTREELYYYALVFPLLEDAGFKLIWSTVFGCGRFEHDGCLVEMQGKMSMSCGSKLRNKINKVPIGRSCHDWLWAKV